MTLALLELRGDGGQPTEHKIPVDGPLTVNALLARVGVAEQGHQVVLDGQPLSMNAVVQPDQKPLLRQVSVYG